MQTALSPSVKDTPQGHEAEAILRKCVHCGFCLATCPTYQLLGDELDSPRGRIYLMKQMLEGEPVSGSTQLHLDRCLTCRSCETTCPSGVQYGKLLDIGRAVVEQKVERPPASALTRYLLRQVIPHTRRFAALLGLARALRPLLPARLRAKVPARSPHSRLEPWPAVRHARKVVMLEGCVQPALEPGINLAAARVLDRIGISVVRTAPTTCCGALSHHLSAHEEALEQARRNIDAFWPHVEAGMEAVIITASACASMVMDYGQLLKEDLVYGPRAARISALARDISQVIAAEADAVRALAGSMPFAGSRLLVGSTPGCPAETASLRVAFHSPCSLQHGLKVKGIVESVLGAAGFTLTAVRDGHLCCGSAGTYSILQPELSDQLRGNKVSALLQDAPEVIVTANIGCLTHIRGGTDVPVRHWIELLAERIAP